MNEKQVSEKQVREANDFLGAYTFNCKLLKLDRYEKEYFPSEQREESVAMGDIALARARMYEIRHFINSLPNCDEKLFLYYRYVRGESVERCAEMLGISRSSAYRLKNRALSLAASVMAERNGDL